MAKKRSKRRKKTNGPSKANYTDNVILYLSDLHFKADSHPVQATKRETLLNHLIERLTRIEPQWKPNIICITGDIASSAKEEEYQLAQKWLNRLLSGLNISSKNIVLCPGNHDVDIKKAALIKPPKNTIEANEFLTVPIPSQYQDLFSTYIDFCKSLKVPSPICGRHYSHLFGIRRVNGIYFIVCNSCWFFKNKKRPILRILKAFVNKIKWLGTLINLDDSIDEKMWLVLHLFEYLENNSELSSLKNSNPVIALLHHPERYLHNEEAERFDHPPTIRWIENRTDLIMTGHSHSLPLQPNGHTINCGAGFRGWHDRNVFCLIKVEDERFLCQYYSSDENRIGNKWEYENQTHPIFFSRTEKYANDIVSKGFSLRSLNNALDAATSAFPKQLKIESNNLVDITGEPLEKPIDARILDIPSIVDNLKVNMAKAQDYIGKLEYKKSFSIADDVINELKEMESQLPAGDLAEIYSALANIEITRVNWLNQVKGIPKDFSRVKEFYRKAKEYYDKG